MVLRKSVVSEESNQNCDPLYGQVDAILELLTKSKSLHILMVLHQKKGNMRFSEIKDAVDASSTTISRRLGELIQHGLVVRTLKHKSTTSHEYSISEHGENLSPIMKSFYEWVGEGSSQESH